jgi:hypothetical protein
VGFGVGAGVPPGASPKQCTAPTFAFGSCHTAHTEQTGFIILSLYLPETKEEESWSTASYERKVSQRNSLLILMLAAKYLQGRICICLVLAMKRIYPNRRKRMSPHQQSYTFQLDKDLRKHCCCQDGLHFYHNDRHHKGLGRLILFRQLAFPNILAYNDRSLV